MHRSRRSSSEERCNARDESRSFEAVLLRGNEQHEPNRHEFVYGCSGTRRRTVLQNGERRGNRGAWLVSSYPPRHWTYFSGEPLVFFSISYLILRRLTYPFLNPWRRAYWPAYPTRASDERFKYLQQGVPGVPCLLDLTGESIVPLATAPVVARDSSS